ncbi:DUF2333 family protein [Arhodomonas sp. AD133]|uniref:DUF2333 family protein n=1 Tax=Arhodomonas sp. AD133 TaxID=3415009 RepID=UPI003EC13E82
MKRRYIAGPAGIAVAVIVIVLVGLGWYWSRSPEPFEVIAKARDTVPGDTDPATIPGSVTVSALMGVASTLLDKPGGYLGNDVTPPSVLLDNMPRWEFGALVQVRDLAQALRNDMSRSRSQSSEDTDLAIAEPQFNFPADSWMFPASESEYRKGIKALDRYLTRLANPDDSNTQFYARADNLNEWLGVVNKRLGSLAQRLSASVGEYRFNVDLAGDPSARQSTPKHSQQIRTETPWLEIDDVFYEARGSTWALVHFLRAARVDFRDVLEDKNAEASLDQIIQALEQTQRPLWSPTVLNGDGYGVLANHSLTIASYIARANAAIIELQQLLTRG